MFTFANVKRFLRRHEDALSEIIDERVEWYNQFGPPNNRVGNIGIREARALLQQKVKPFVHGLLDTNCEVPIRVVDDLFRSNYQPWRNRIRLEPNPEYAAVPVLVHEYTHHVQWKNLGNRRPKSRTFTEGHARGVERTICELEAKEGNIAPLQYFYYYYIDELLVVKEWLDGKHKTALTTPHNLQFNKIGTIEHAVMFQITAGRYTKKNHHALGHALFAIAEVKHGPGIYAEAMRNPRAVLE